MKRANALILILLTFLGMATLGSATTMAAPQGLIKGNRASLSYMQERIRKKLASLPYYSVFDNLNFSFDGETVVLGGEVVRPSTREDAEQAVRNIEGVETVVNRIEVLPLSTIDERIRAVAYERIFSHPQLSRYSLQAVPPIHIIVKNSTIRLEGVVANSADKTIAGMIANQVNGVFSVENNLQVEGK